MTLDERTARILGWSEVGGVWGQTAYGMRTNRVPVYTSWHRAEEMIAWLQARCYLEVHFEQGNMVYVTARKGVATGFLACEHGETFPEALAKVVVCVAEALETGQEAVYREEKP